MKNAHLSTGYASNSGNVIAIIIVASIFLPKLIILRFAQLIRFYFKI